MTREIKPEPLTAAAFAPFGEVIETGDRRPEPINQGATGKYADLARLEAGTDGRLGVHIYRSVPRTGPILIRELERHVLGSQAFIPLHDRPFPLVVAAPGTEPASGDVRVFLSNGRQGINLKPGTWHHPLLGLEEAADYLVIERIAAEPDCQTRALSEPFVIAL